MGGLIFLILILVLVVVIVTSCIKVVPQARAYVIERLGLYQGTWEPGLHFKVPVIDRVAKRVNLKEQVVDFPPQPVITKDNVTMRIDTVVFYQITDSKSYTYNVENPIMAIENLTATTLRNIIGDMELDETLTSREVINTKMRAALDIATDPWGIKVNRVELKNIMPPAAIQEAMEKQMKAERERREAILIAEGEKKSTVLVAEGKKESAILEAEAEKQHARLYTADVSKVTVETETLKEIRFDHPGLGTVKTRLTGTYQVENCCLAITVLKEILGIADRIIIDGIKNTVWPGRFEVIGEQPLFIIDGAHNEDAALQLSASVEKYFTNIPITYIIGVLADKEHKKVLEAMLPYAGATFTVTPDNPRAMKAEELASEAEAIVARLWKERAGKPEKVQGTENSPQGAGGMEPLPKVSACSSMKEAVQLALEHTKKDGVILAFGSLSYLKEIRQIMQSD